MNECGDDSNYFYLALSDYGIASCIFLYPFRFAGEGDELERGALVGELTVTLFFGLVLSGSGYFFMILYFYISYLLFAYPDLFVITYWFSLRVAGRKGARVTGQSICIKIFFRFLI